MGTARIINLSNQYSGKKSYKLLLMSFATLALLALNGIFTYYHVESTINDAKVINYSGVIRGSIQRVAKLELANMKNDDIIEYIDGLIDEFDSGILTLKGNNAQFMRDFASINVSWNYLKSLLHLYRDGPSDINKIRLIEASERLWEEANAAVFSAQNLSEKKMKHYYYTIAISLFNLVLMSAIILIIKAYVRDKLEFQASHDPLTRAYNRNFLYEYLRNETLTAQGENRGLSVISFDIDHFKLVNDRYGHDVGDYVLTELTRIISHSIRKEDILSRVGGEEFIVITHESDIEKVKAFAERLRKAVEEHLFETVGRVTVSIGIAKYNEEDTLSSILKRADDALYMSKNTGRNKVTFI